jgi:hypothetical protein
LFWIDTILVVIAMVLLVAVRRPTHLADHDAVRAPAAVA